MKTEFLNLPDHRQYHLLSAIRGPDLEYPPFSDVDVPEENLKRIITERIRSIIFYKHECEAGYTDLPLGIDDVEDLKRILTMPLPRYAHFILHLRLAVYFSMNHPVWGEFGEELYSLLVRNEKCTEEE